MCFHGTYEFVEVINPNQQSKRVKIDACISDEIRSLNDQGIVTLGSCCGHGNAGQVEDWENAFGKWKSCGNPPLALIDEVSVKLAANLGYRPFPYMYADGISNGVWQMYLKTGCITKDDCQKWHDKEGQKPLSLSGIL
ncbi:hypothetical protein [Halalkalibacter oceani]|uniref:hypothetical protein n=1 Tax=Halalkalibacter oceani TaxID=1653776 RepID=UPI003396ADA4